MLRGLRPGVEKTLIHHPDFAAAEVGMIIESDAFGPDESIAQIHTDDGTGESPPLRWSGVPPNASSLVIVVEDADSPTPSPFVHLLAWGLPAKDGSLGTGAFRSKGHEGANTRVGRNGLGKCEYAPPDPLPGHGRHRYVFQLFALDHRVDFPSPPNRAKLKTAMHGHVLSKGVLTGTYERP
jgi:Raf kinase inhibitor-like YbhB/YbcL family protein